MNKIFGQEFTAQIEIQERQFGDARCTRNIFERVIESQAFRIITTCKHDAEMIFDLH